MNYRRNMLLASIASLALVVGAGLAQAQEKEKAPQAAPPHAAQPMSKAPAAAEQPKAGAPNQRAEEMNRPKAAENPNAMGAKPAQRAEENERMKPAQKAEENERMKSGQKAEENERMNKPGNKAAESGKGEMQKPNTAAERGNENKSARSSAAANVKLSSEQRTRIKSVVMAGRGGPRVAHVNFDIRVGTVIPRGGVEYVPIPETLVAIEPMWRGFDYFIYGEELVIIDPDTL